MRFRRSTTRSERGFTLIELLITISIIAILAAIALPSFARVIASNRVASGVNEFIAAVNLARMEAIRRGVEAGVCASADGSTCGTDWDKGYMVYYTVKSGGASMEEPLREGHFSPKDTLTNSGAGGKIKFDNRGRVAGGAQLGFKFKPVDTKYADLQRCLFVTVAGSVTAKSTTAECES